VKATEATRNEPMARPSSPSVRFTALAAPVSTSAYEERVEQAQEQRGLLEEREGELGGEEALVRHGAEQAADREREADLEHELATRGEPRLCLRATFM
jgi:hypothetical protein